MSAPLALFKHFKLGNYSLKKSNSLIFNVLNTHVFIKSYYLRHLKSALGTLVNISIYLFINKIF